MDEQMRREYKDALDGLSFSGGEKERIMNNLMEQEMERTVKGKRLWPMRAALIAAALCGALIMTAGAVQFSGARINWQVEAPEAPFVSGSNYSAKVEITCFPEDSFPQQVRDLAKQDSLVGKNFKSWTKLEEFLARDLPDSTALESAQPGPRAVISRAKGGTNILLCIRSCREGIFSLEATGHYILDGIWIEQEARLYTDKAEENYKKAGMEFDPEDILMYEGGRMAEEIYTTPSGLTATIVSVTPSENSAKFVTEYNAHFSINGIQYRASAETDAVGYTPDTVPENPAHTLKSVLDGFLLE